jgi:hypothetical protein
MHGVALERRVGGLRGSRASEPLAPPEPQQDWRAPRRRTSDAPALAASYDRGASVPPRSARTAIYNIVHSHPGRRPVQRSSWLTALEIT